MKNINFVPNVVGRSMKKLLFNISQYSHENNVWVSLLIKMQTFRPATLLKEDAKQLLSWQYWGKIFRNSYFEEHL